MDDLYAELESFEIPYKRDVNIGKLTWYGAGGSADCLARPESIEQLQDLVRCCKQRAKALRILGGGANLLVRDGQIDGVVVALDNSNFKQIEISYEDEQKVSLKVGAGYDLFKLVQYTAKNGYLGLEQIAGVPGTVGGAVKMNAGGFFGNISRNISQVTVIDKDGEKKVLPAQKLEFAYRSSNINESIITSATFNLTRADSKLVREKVKEIFNYKKNSQPMADSTAGCAFKNPIKDSSQSAGQLIECAGLKGYPLGTARVSKVHANFIATVKDARGKCAADDVAKLIEYVQKEVQNKFAINLEREVKIWPDDR